MGDKINLKELERKAYLSYHKDGLLDIFIGFSILLFGLWMLADMFYLAGTSVAIFMPLYMQSKKQITIPRMGYVKFGPSRIAKSKKTMLALVLIGVLAFIPGLLLAMQSTIPSWLPVLIEEYGMILVGVIGMTVVSVVAYISEVNRFYAYAILFLATFIVSHLLYIPVFYSVIVLGTMITLSGAYMLTGFLRENPLTIGDTTNDRE
jgi:hypothetical protein